MDRNVKGNSLQVYCKHRVTPRYSLYQKAKEKITDDGKQIGNMKLKKTTDRQRMANRMAQCFIAICLPSYSVKKMCEEVEIWYFYFLYEPFSDTPAFNILHYLHRYNVPVLILINADGGQCVNSPIFPWRFIELETMDHEFPF